MLFNTFEFAVFFAIVVALYFAMRRRFRWQNLMLLAASYVFYGWWDVRFLFLIVISTVIDYTCGLMIDRGVMSGRQRAFASLYLLASAAAFLLVPDILPSAIAALRTGDGPDWSLLAADRVAWTTFVCSLGVVVVANLMYGRVTRWQETVRRRFFLVVSVAGNLGILFVFKYFDFFATSFAAVVEGMLGVTPGAWTLDVVLPVGISFYTFQTMSYTIDVYRRELASSDHFVEFATYVAFFPQLVAG
ncbi:MAG: MBOAT family O-acyltransferase, partial [Planctomycetota bacterium]